MERKRYSAESFPKSNSKRRKRNKQKLRTMNSPDKRRLRGRNMGVSWYEHSVRTFPEGHSLSQEDIIDANVLDMVIEYEKSTNNDISNKININPLSASRKKIELFYPPNEEVCSESSDSDSDDDLFDSENENTERDKNYCKHWIIDVEELQTNISSIAVCRQCHGNLSISEDKSYRAGLGTKFLLKCLNEKCSSQVGFNTSKKTGKVFDINRKLVLAFRLIGKGHSSARKVASVLGIANPVNATSYAAHTNYWEEKSFDAMNESMTRAANLAKRKEIKVTGSKPNDNSPIDISVCFDGSWKSPGWSSTKELWECTGLTDFCVKNLEY